MQITAYFDGSCNPNPGGVIGLGCVIYSELHSVKQSKKILRDPYNTNNIAEYEALYFLLTLLLKYKLETKSIIVYGDSNMIINQINGEWKVNKPHLQVLNKKCKDLLPLFHHIEFEWIPRELNKVADALSN